MHDDIDNFVQTAKNILLSTFYFSKENPSILLLIYLFEIINFQKLSRKLIVFTS